SGIAGGLAISGSLVAEGSLHAHLPASPSRELLVSLGYPIGFVMVVLGRMQLFTESTVTAMIPLVMAPSRQSMLRTLRLWTIVLAANLIGTFTTAAAFALLPIGGEGMRAGMIEVSMRILGRTPLEVLANAVPAGFLIAIVSWALANAREQAFFVIFGIVYLIAIGGFSHSVVGSNEAFLLLLSGKAGFAETIPGFLLPAILGNLIGGAGVFALLAHAQVRDDMGRAPGAEKKKKRPPRLYAGRNDR
ncbi:MAG: formate/nitrite transporter family protein, partial [Sphingomonas sp.]|nr:formate/nitrite transporter family protein [Sphingomonas sp.]